MKLGSEKTIEGLKFFPLIAWGVFVLFAAFVYLLANELQQTATTLEAASNETAEMMGALGTTSAPRE